MKQIRNYENYYITEDGKVYSSRSDKYLKPQTNNWGYLEVDLCNEEGKKHRLIHRLVAEAYIPNPNNLPCVNHKDEDKTNNSVNNLEWCTVAYNNSYGSRVTLCCKSVEQLDDKGNILNKWDSITDASNKLNICRQSISKVLNGKRKTAGGYWWRYSSD